MSADRTKAEFRDRFATRAPTATAMGVPFPAMAVVTERAADSAEPQRPARVPGATPTEGAIAGVVAAGVALGVSELVCGIAGAGPTLVTAVGTQFIDRFAASLKDLAVELFGTNDKAALVTGIVIVSIALGAVVGKATARRWWVGVVGFVAFGIVGLWSYLESPLGTPITGVVAAILAVAAGVATLFGLLRLLRTGRGALGSSKPADRASSRRMFLTAAGSLAVLAAGAAVLGKRFGRSDVVEQARQATSLPTPTGSTVPPVAPTAGPIPQVPGLSSLITPSSDFYRIDTALTIPQVDVGSWKLSIKGMVDNEISFTYDELVKMADFEDTVTMQCVSNYVGGNLVGNATWQGVHLKTLLDKAGVQEGATQVVGHSVDDFTAGFPTEVGLDGRTAMVAVAMNGEPLPAVHGFPARLVVAGLYGYVSATKWLDSIYLVPWDEFDGYWVPRGWSKEGPIKLASRIDVPRSGATVDAGTQPIAGVAWQPDVGIARVEVQVDDTPWQVAQLGDATSDNTWVQWYLPWSATSGKHSIRVRATNAKGEVQTEEQADPAPDGATGWHTKSVRVR
jgi:DMSO/TMAO reductase YedYZ molybdopterin-dependent catalytic subunit